MNQSRTKSLIESLANVVTGFLISLIFWSAVIVPLYDMKVSFIQNLEITGLFTLLAIVRSYIIRRIFNKI